jgi:hypothetical protein
MVIGQLPGVINAAKSPEKPKALHEPVWPVFIFPSVTQIVPASAAGAPTPRSVHAAIVAATVPAPLVNERRRFEFLAAGMSYAVIDFVLMAASA